MRIIVILNMAVIFNRIDKIIMNYLFIHQILYTSGTWDQMSFDLILSILTQYLRISSNIIYKLMCYAILTTSSQTNNNSLPCRNIFYNEF